MSDDNPTPADPAAEPETPDLGDAGKKAIAAERARADNLDKQLKAMLKEKQDRDNAELSELERFKKENEELRSGKSAADLEALRYSVALEKGLPANLAARLNGTDRESIEADADSLAELVGQKSNTPRPDLSQGPKAQPGTGTPREQFAALFK